MPDLYIIKKASIGPKRYFREIILLFCSLPQPSASKKSNRDRELQIFFVFVQKNLFGIEELLKPAETIMKSTNKKLYFFGYRIEENMLLRQ